METQRNNGAARFWVRYNDGYVRLALRDGDEIALEEGGQTEEGYSYEWETYSRDGEIIRLSWGSCARDCDGVIERCGECETSIHTLESVAMPDWLVNEGAPAMRPQWECVR